MPENAPETAKSDTFKEFEEGRVKLAELERQQALLHLGASFGVIRRAVDDPTHALYQLPEGADNAQLKEQAQLHEALVTLSHAVDGVEGVRLSGEKIAIVEDMVKSAESRIVEFERVSAATARKTLDAILGEDSVKPHRERLRTALGLGGTPEQFDDFMRYAAKEIPAPKPVNAELNAEQSKKLRVLHAELSGLQYKMVDRVFNLSILELYRREKFPQAVGGEAELSAKEKQEVIDAMGRFLIKRAEYDALLSRQPAKQPSQVMAIFGSVIEEVAEEGFEGSISFGEPVFKAPEALRGLTSAAQMKMMEGFEGAGKLLGARCPTLATILGGIDKSPFGRNFWSKLLEVESPATVVLFMIHVHNSPNKLKATMDFASFLALSATSSALLECTTVLLVTAAKTLAAQKNFRAAHALMWLARSPKHPAIQFGAALAIAFGLAPVIDRFTTWVDSMIPESEFKRSANDAVSILSGSSIVETLEWGATEAGMLHVDPEEDAFAYMSKELIMYDASSDKLKRSKVNGLLDWNDAVDRRINAEWNPLAKKLFTLEKANYGPWAQREAFYMFSIAQHAKQLQGGIAAELLARGKIGNEKEFDFLRWATSDDSTERPDHLVAQLRTDAVAFARLTGMQSSTEGRMAAYLDGLKDSKEPKDKQLYGQWKEYMSTVEDVAKRATTFRHVGVYDKEKWLGADGAGMPAYVQQGLASEILYRMDRDEILKYKEQSQTARDEFARSLAALSKPNYKKHDVSDVWFHQIFTSGFLIDPRSHFHKASLLAAAEAAVQYLPKDHDVNVLFADLRASVVHKKPLSEKEMDELRDAFSAAMLRYQETQSRLTSGAAGDVAGLPSRFFFAGKVNKDFAEMYAKNVNDGKDPSYALFSYAFKDDFASEKDADVHVLQSIIPGYRTGEMPSKYECAVLTHTAIRCNGDDPKEWRVRVARRHMARNAFTDVRTYERLQAPSERSETVVLDFPTWAAAHPEFAEQLKPALDPIRAAKDAKRGELEAPRNKALERARTSTDVFVPIPGSKEYRRAADGGQAIVHELPQVGSFNSDPDPYEFGTPGKDFGATAIAEYAVDIEKGGSRKTLKIAPGSFRDIDAMPANDKRLIRDIITTPIDGHPSESIAATLNVFDRPHDSVSAAGYAFGWRPTFHYSTLLKGALPLYEKAAQKKMFLEDLHDFILSKGGKIDEATAAGALQMLEKRGFMYGEKFGATERNRYLKIAAALGTPDANGIFTKDAGGNGETIYYYFHPETMRWQWSFDKQNWQRMDNMTGKTSRGSREPNLFNQVYMREVLPSFLAK